MGRASRGKRGRRQTPQRACLEGWPPLLWLHSLGGLAEAQQLHVAGIRPVFTPATHGPTGVTFVLASVPDGPILAVAPLGKQAAAVAKAGIDTHDDPAHWANAQPWRVVRGISLFWKGGTS